MVGVCAGLRRVGSVWPVSSWDHHAQAREVVDNCKKAISAWCGLCKAINSVTIGRLHQCTLKGVAGVCQVELSIV